ncbi:MAG: hypothetical protein QOF22_1050 [Bradyrhizobium sp.]|nr:hypothetical protein [Bradyrhizobium sp.]
MIRFKPDRIMIQKFTPAALEISPASTVLAILLLERGHAPSDNKTPV